MNPRRSHNREFFYKYTLARTAKIILSSRKLRWSNPTVFNDPYDVPREIFAGVEASEVQSAAASIMMELIDKSEMPFRDQLNPKVRILLDAYSRAPEELKTELRAECRSFASSPTSSRDGLDQMQKLWQDTYLDQRIICFTEDWDSSSMWDRYADGHRGVALEFRCLDKLDCATLAAQPVQYVDGALAPDTAIGFAELMFYQPQFAIRRFLHQYTHTKTSDWSNEKEWRIASSRRSGETGDFSDYGFFADELGSVIFGKAISEEDREDIVLLCRKGEYSGVDLWQAEDSGGRRLSRRSID